MFNKPNNSTPRLNHAAIQTSAYGVAIPLGWGTFRSSVNLLWMGPLKSVAVKNSTGGKGGARSTSKTYNYSADVIMGICSGPIVGVKEVFKDQSHFVDGDLHTRYTNVASALSAAGSNELATDYTTLASLASAINTSGTTALQGAGLSLATGALGQAAQGFLTGDDAIGYSLLAYAYAQDYALSSQATLSNHTLTVSSSTRAVVGGQTLDDALPDDMLTDFLTNTYFAVPGWLPGYLGDYTEWRTASTAYGLFLSHCLNSQVTAAQCVDALCLCSNAESFWSEGKLKVRPYADTVKTANGVTFTPNLTPIYSFNDTDYLYKDGQDPIRITIKDVADSYNYVQIQYQDRTHQYNSVTQGYPEQASIDLYGKRPEPPVSMDAVKMPSIATALGRLRVQRLANTWETYTWDVGEWAALLEPMDLVELTDSASGMDAKLARVLSVQENEIGFTITAEEMLVGASHVPLLTHQQPSAVNTDFDAAPGDVSPPVLINPPRTITAAGGCEAWLAVAGGVNFGGCSIWVSLDGTNYEKKGEIVGSSRYGTLTASLPVGTDPDTTNTLSVDLSSSDGTLDSTTTTTADAGGTLCMIDGELISYETATLTALHQYDITYLRRGLYQTSIAAHSSGAHFVRLDDQIFKYPYTDIQIGSTIYVKFTAFNQYGRQEQDLSSVTAYSVTLSPINQATLDVIANVVVDGVGPTTDVGTMAVQNSDAVDIQGGTFRVGTLGAIITSYDQPTVPIESNAELYHAWNDTSFANLPTSDPGSTLYQGGTSSGTWLVSRSDLEFKNNDLLVPIERRIRTGSVRFHAAAWGTVDNWVSIWYSINGGSPVFCSLAVSPASGSDYGRAEVSVDLTINTGDVVKWYASIADSSGNPYSVSHDNFIYAGMVVTARNF